jgi:rhamnosyltransferase
VTQIRREVCAVVITYFPQRQCVDNLAALAPQVGELIVVDNGSSLESWQPVEAAARRLDVTLVRLGANRGIATALNEGLMFAKAHGYRWLATFDQDSRATPDMIREMLAALESHPCPRQVAVISACHIDPLYGFDFRYPVTDASGEGWRAVPFVMTSGNLIDVRTVSAAGGFEDSFFMDYVDIEFCLRLRRLGYQILEATRARLLHSLGRFELRRFLFRRLPVTNHSALRRYYITRNRLILWRRYWRREPLWFILDLYGFLYDCMVIVLYESGAGAKLSMLVRGLRDGWRRVGGPFRPECGGPS